MVLHFPNKLTEEEQALMSKYAKLRRKKKQLADVTKPKQEPEKNISKKPSESKDAKEVAKKLIKTGAIRAIKSSINKEKIKDEKHNSGFKRSQGFERKQNQDRAMSSYQPFSATHGPGGGFDTGGEDFEPEISDEQKKTKQKNLYETFVKERDNEERGLGGAESKDKPRQGHTVYVYGYGVTEDILKNQFTPYGPIVNISMEVEKNCGFITYEKVESAQRAIAEINGSLVSGVQLKVSLARRQPIIDPINDSSSSTTWSTIAASHSQKGSHKDKREMVAYDDDLF